MNLSASEMRVLGCLLEKQLTTPDVYPLTLNACDWLATSRPTATRWWTTTTRSCATRCTGWSGAASRAWPAGRQPRAEVPPSAGRSAADERRGAGVHVRADAARPADAGRAQAAHRAHARVRRSGRGARDARAADRARAGDPPASAGRGRRRSATRSCSSADAEESAQAAAQSQRRRSGPGADWVPVTDLVRGRHADRGTRAVRASGLERARGQIGARGRRAARGLGEPSRPHRLRRRHESEPEPVATFRP